MSEYFELHRGVVFPKDCDHLGHMNVRYYAGHFDDAGFHLWNKIGINQKELREAKICLVVAKIEINYIREMVAGDLLVIDGAYTKLGSKSLCHHQRMFNAETKTLCATQDTVEVFFNLESRKSTEMPDFIRERLTQYLVSHQKKPSD